VHIEFGHESKLQNQEVSGISGFNINNDFEEVLPSSTEYATN